jgi:hypothetical protein
MDTETAKAEIVSALDAMAKTLRAGEAETRYLERLLRDRDEMLTFAHFTLGIPILELAERTGIPWTQLFDVVDRVRDEKRAEARPQWLKTALSECTGCAEHPVAAPEETTDGEAE